MSNPQRFLGGPNKILSAIFASGAIKPCQAIRRGSVVRTGNGRIQVTGAYTGAADTTIDVEIGSGGSLPMVSTPTPSGVGNPSLNDLAAKSGAISENYTLTLIDTGTVTAPAEAILDGYRLRARGAGAGGNLLNITVDDSGLTYTATGYSLLTPIPEGGKDFIGSGWDWGSLAAIDTQVPAAAARVVIGDDKSVVYRNWRVYEAGQWHYRLLPAAVRTYAAKERIYTVSGSRTITLSDGTTTETYPNIVTLRDLLVALQASNLVEPLEIPPAASVSDNLPAVVDLRLRTAARVDFTTGQGSEYARGFINTFANASASTEIVEARCFANDVADGAGVGRERWKLYGSVSGDLGTISTAEEYVEPTGKFGFTIPTRVPPGWSDNKGMFGVEIGYTSRADGEPEPPPICLSDRRLGPNARDTDITWTYTQRPTGECACENVDWQPLPGIGTCMDAESSGEVDMSAMLATQARWRAEFTTWYNAAITAQTEITAAGELRTAINDVQLARAILNIFTAAIDKTFLSGRTSWPARTTSTAYALNDGVQNAATPNGYLYRAQVAGTSGSGSVTWPTTIDATVVDGTVTWRCVSRLPATELAQALTDLKTDWAKLDTMAAETTTTALAYVLPFTAYTAGATQYLMTIGGSGGIECIVTCYRSGTTSAGTPYGAIDHSGPPVPGDIVSLASNTLDSPVLFKVESLVGTLDAESINNVQDSIHQTGISRAIGDFVQRYEARAAHLLTIAELPFDLASSEISESSDCWLDPGDSFWWVPSSTGYVPAFSNVQYASVKYGADGHVETEGTHEFAFVIKVACPERLKPGDQFAIHIGDAARNHTYEINDVLSMAILATSPFAFSGGVTGTDTYTWTVRGEARGALPNYSQVLASPALYSDAQIEFRIAQGGIPAEVGHQFRFCVSAPRFRWRKGAGAWSAWANIAPGSLSDGLSVAFSPGACPPWVAGDSASFAVLQAYALANAYTPDDGIAAWDGASCEIDFITSGTVDCVMLARHSLPATAVVTVTDGGSLSETIPWRSGPMVLMLDAPLTAPSLTVQISNAAGGSIGWLWAGQSLELQPRTGCKAEAAMATSQIRRRLHQILEGEGGINPSAMRLGHGWGYDLAWSGFVPWSQVTRILDLLDWAHDGNYPVAWLPNAAIPSEAELVRLPAELSLADFWDYRQATFGETDRAIEFAMTLHPFYEPA